MSTRHEGSGQSTDLPAIHVHRDALGHRLDVRLLQTRYCAVVAGHCTCVAGFDTGGVFLVGHFGFLGYLVWELPALQTFAVSAGSAHGAFSTQDLWSCNGRMTGVRTLPAWV